VGAVNLPASLGRGGTLAVRIALVDDGEVEEIAAEREIEMFRRV
jgi:hypothetical protein